MSYVLLNAAGAVAIYPYSIGQLRVDNPNTSFPEQPTPAQLAEFNTFFVSPTPQPSYDWITETCVEGTPAKTGEEWLQTWVVTQNTPEQITANEAQARANNKSIAAQLLSETDWVDIPAVSDPANNPHLVNRDGFNAYRLQLRGIAVTPPVTVDPWPVKPMEIWSS